MGLSALIITYNVESCIEKCLESLSFADEIVVVDSYSTDRTVEIAKRYTDNITLRKFTGFSEQRNASLALAQHEWVFIIDADEVVPPKLAKELVGAMNDGRHAGYRIPRLTYFLGKPICHCGWYPDMLLRLVRRDLIRIPHRLVHESILSDGTTGDLRNNLLHYSYSSLDDYIRKMVIYARAAAEQKLIDGHKFHITDVLLKPWLTFLKMYLLKQGWRDGLHGFMICVLSAFSVFLRYSMLWEMTMRRNKCKE